MSLVNQVLKDLQQRHGESADTSGLMAAPTIAERRPWARWVAYGAAAVVIGVGAFAIERMLQKGSSPLGSSPTVRQEATVASTHNADPEPDLTPRQPVVEPDLAPRPGSSPTLLPEATVASTHDADPEPDLTPRQLDADPEPDLTPRQPDVPAQPDLTAHIPLQRTLVATTPRQRADDAYAAGVRALSEGAHGQAERQFRAALGHDPGMYDARLALANLLASGGQLREAEIQLQQGLRIAPGAAPLAERYARILLERGDLAGAIGVLADSPPPLDSAPEYHSLLAALLQRAGNHAAAADVYSALVDVRPERGVWWMGLAISLEMLDRRPAALDAYRRAAGDPRLTADVAQFVRARIDLLDDA